MHRLIFIALFVLTALTAQAQADDSPQQQHMAQQMADWMDSVWDQQPHGSKGNVRILVLRNGEPFAGELSTTGHFKVKLEGLWSQSTTFNPNSNGRYVLEGVDPGSYKVYVSGLHDLDGFEWSMEIAVDAGETPVIEVELDE